MIKRILAITIGSSLIVVSPGPGCYKALGQMYQSGQAAVPVAIPVPVYGITPVIDQLGAQSFNIPGLGQGPDSFSLGAIPSTRLNSTNCGLSVNRSANHLKSTAKFEVKNLPSRSIGPRMAAALTVSGKRLRTTGLANSVRNIAKASVLGTKGPRGILDRIFCGFSPVLPTLNVNGHNDSMARRAPGTRPVPKPLSSSDYHRAMRYARRVFNGDIQHPNPRTLQKNIKRLRETASDSKALPLDRVVAINTLGKIGSEKAKDALKEISRSNPNGDATEYEIKRAALSALADLGVVLSLPAVSLEHAKEILSRIKNGSAAKMVIIVDGSKTDPKAPNTFLWPTTGPMAKPEIISIITNRNTSETTAIVRRTPNAFAETNTAVTVKRISGTDKQAAATPPQDTPQNASQTDEGEPTNRKALATLILQRVLSIFAFILTMIAYPLLAMPLVGDAQYGTLLTIGPIAGAAMAPINGILIDKLSIRNAMTINSVARALLSLSLPVLLYFGVLNHPSQSIRFYTLAISSVLNSWIFVSILITEGAFLRKIVNKKKLRHTNAALFWIFPFLWAVLGTLLGIGKLVDNWAPTTPFLISAAINGLIVAPLVFFLMPNIKNASKSAVKKAADTVKSSPAFDSLKKKLGGIRRYVRSHLLEMAVMGGAIALYSQLSSTIPIALALAFWISRTKGFKNVWKAKPVLACMTLMLIGAFLSYPLKTYALPLMAKTLVGAEGKGFLLGQLLGVLSLGQVISYASMAKLPFSLKLMKRNLSINSIMRALTLGLTGAWVYFRIFPGSLLAAGIGMAGALLLFRFISRLSERGSIKFYGLGLATLWIPLLFWGSVPVLFFAIITMGIFQAASTASITGYFQKNIPRESAGSMYGIKSSFFSASLALGYGTLALLATVHKPALPGMLLPMCIMFTLGALVFWFAPRFLPGLSKSLFQKPGERKPKDRPAPAKR